MKEWQIKHRQVIGEFLPFLNEHSDKYILKGGTALYLCYKLDRFSEDIDLDGNEKGISEIVEKYCEKEGYTYTIKKNTTFGERYMVDYGNQDHPLKIEVSYRIRDRQQDTQIYINGILTYDINTLCFKKVAAYNGRDKIRDLYDIIFIFKNYCDELSTFALENLIDAIEHKGLDYCDYIIKTQADPLIDTNRLMNDFLDMYEKMGLYVE